jgi:hypothetical protein
MIVQAGTVVSRLARIAVGESASAVLQPAAPYAAQLRNPTGGLG